MADRALLVSVIIVVALLGSIVVLTATPTPPENPTRTQPISTTADFERLHNLGITGTNVTVGVVDVTGFDSRAPPLAGRIAGTRSFGTSSAGSIAASHGTAAATVIARTAPDAMLYLASVGGVSAYGQSIDWLRRQGVDVIVAPVSFYGQLGDGSGRVGRLTEQATEAGITFVAPTGNLANSHWRGTYNESTVDNGTVAVTSESYRIPIRGPTNVTVWLSWERDHADEPYAVDLYRTDVSGPRLVATSQPYPGDGVPNERIIADVTPGQYALVVRGPADPTGAKLRVVSPTHEFARSTKRGSIVAPGTADGALTVGAYNDRTDTVEPFSSRGPTADGRSGIDIVAPNRQFAGVTERGFIGSSAATPYVGGLVALMLDVAPSLSPAHAELLIELTATDVGVPGIDYESGHGVVAPRAAVSAAENTTLQRG
jgi:hypothetical protein